MKYAMISNRPRTDIAWGVLRKNTCIFQLNFIDSFDVSFKGQLFPYFHLVYSFCLSSNCRCQMIPSYRNDVTFQLQPGGWIWNGTNRLRIEWTWPARLRESIPSLVSVCSSHRRTVQGESSCDEEEKIKSNRKQKIPLEVLTSFYLYNYSSKGRDILCPLGAQGNQQGSPFLHLILM